MTKLPDEKLIDKIMEDISNFAWINDLEDIVVPVYRVEQILQKHLTNPTDEGIEKYSERELRMLNCIIDLRNQYIGKDGHMFMSTGEQTEQLLMDFGIIKEENYQGYLEEVMQEPKEVEGIEKEEPTPIKNILSKLVKERDATNNGEYNYDQTEIGYANGLARAIQIIEQEPIGHKELVSVTCPKCGLLIKNPLYKDNMPKEVKPPTKDTSYCMKCYFHRG